MEILNEKWKTPASPMGRWAMAVASTLFLSFPSFGASSSSINAQGDAHLLITEVMVGFEDAVGPPPCSIGDDTITIRGDGFDSGDAPVVRMLGDQGELDVCAYSATEILVRCPPDPDNGFLGTCTEGDYLLSVDIGRGDRGYDEYDLTVGAVGPVGPAGPKGDVPDHAWSGTRLRFENPDGSWGTYVDLQGEPGTSGADGLDGLHCWDRNGDGDGDPEEDRDGNGLFNADDCQGPPGEPGKDGLNCWDLDGDGVNDPEEDRDGNGLFNAGDCQGPPGESPTFPLGLIDEINRAHCGLAGLAAHADLWELFENVHTLPLDDDGNPDFFSRLFSVDETTGRLDLICCGAKFHLPDFCFAYCPEELPTGGTLTPGSASPVKTTAVELALLYPIIKLIPALSLPVSRQTSVNDLLSIVAATVEAAGTGSVEQLTGSNSALAGTPGKGRFSSSKEDPQTLNIPPFCVASLLSRVLRSVDAGCDPNYQPVELELTAAIGVLNQFWKDHVLTWGSGEQIEITSYPWYGLVINGEPTFFYFHQAAAGSYVFSDVRIRTTEVDGRGWFYLTVHSIDYTDSFNLNVRCDLQPLPNTTDRYCESTSSPTVMHYRDCDP